MMISGSQVGSILSRQQLEDELWPARLAVMAGEAVPALDELVAGILPGTPEDLRVYAYYAAIWGISDDGYRSQFVNETPYPYRLNLKLLIEPIEDDLDEWLAGPEADSDQFSDAYIAFSAMRMAVHEIWIETGDC